MTQKSINRFPTLISVCVCMSRGTTGARMWMSCKDLWWTRRGKSSTDCLGNGMRVCTVESHLQLNASGDQVHTHRQCSLRLIMFLSKAFLCLMDILGWAKAFSPSDPCLCWSYIGTYYFNVLFLLDHLTL